MFVHVASYTVDTKMNGAAFLRGVIAAFLHRIQTVLTDNGTAFADLPINRSGPTRHYGAS